MALAAIHASAPKMASQLSVWFAVVRVHLPAGSATVQGSREPRDTIAPEWGGIPIAVILTLNAATLPTASRDGIPSRTEYVASNDMQPTAPPRSSAPRLMPTRRMTLEEAMGKQMSVIRGVSSLVALILILGSLGALVLAQESTIGITAQATVASFKWGSWSAQGFSVRVDVQNRGAAPIEFGDTLIVWQGSRDTSTISGEAFVEGDYQVADTREVRDKKRYFVDSFRGVQRDGKVTLSGMSVGPDGAVTIGATTTQMCRLNASGRLMESSRPAPVVASSVTSRLRPSERQNRSALSGSRSLNSSTLKRGGSRFSSWRAGSRQEHRSCS